MPAPNFQSNSEPNPLIRGQSWPPVFGQQSASLLQTISPRPRTLRIAVIGNHLLRQCGIATLTTDLCDAIVAEYEAAGLSVVAIDDPRSFYVYPARVRSEVTEGDIASYRAAAGLLNSNNVDLLCLQHEYRIFGGKAGSHVLQFLRRLQMPAVTTLHTVLREPDADQRGVLQEIAARSDRLVVMSEYSSRILKEEFRVPSEKIDLIPHGIPDMSFVEPSVYKNSLPTDGKTVLLTFGLLSPNKGFESVIRAMPRILSRHSNVVYLIAGATHPHVRAREGDRYRFQLQALAKEVRVGANVIFHNRFVGPQEMASLVGVADLYITPYVYEAQAVSGTLAYAMGAGKAIISTPYWYAAELLADGRGALVPFEDPDTLADIAIELLDNDSARQAMWKRAYLYARSMVWNRVAQFCMRSFVEAIANRMQPAQLGCSVQAVERIAASSLASV